MLTRHATLAGILVLALGACVTPKTPEPYQVAFEKISEAIFMRSQARAATAGPAPAEQRAAVP